VRRAVDLNNIQLSRPWWRWVITGLNILALVLSAILSWHFLRGGSMAGCGGGRPCEQELTSRWSVIAGIFPVSGLAMSVYLALLFAGFFTGHSTELFLRRLAWEVMLVIAGIVAGSAIWFTILQKWVIGQFCPYCMTAHITGFLLALIIVWRAIRERNDQQAAIHPLIGTLSATRLFMAGLAMAGGMALFQSAGTPSAVRQNVESQEQLPAIDYSKAPMAGSPDAPFVVTLLFDYQCSHCQKIHFMLGEAVRRYDGKLAFALCPSPLNSECNPYVPDNVDAFKNSCELARISLAVWVARREVFPEFEDWMFMFESGDVWLPRSPESAREKAVELVGQEAFDAALTDPWAGEYLKTCTRIYGQTLQNGRGGIPKMIFGTRWIIPEPFNADDLIRILQKSLGVPLP